MAQVRNFVRILDGEHVIHEADRLYSRDQVLLAASTTFTRPGTVLGQNTTTMQYAPLNLTATDGTQTPAAVLWAGRPASTGTRRAVVHSRHSRVNGKKLTYPAGATPAQITAINAALFAKGIQVGY